MKPKIFILFLFFILISGANALNVKIQPVKIVDNTYYIVRGDNIRIAVFGDPNQDVDISITCKFDVKASDGTYNYKLKDFPIPIDVKSVTIKSYYVRTLKIYVPIILFIGYSKEVSANEMGIATVPINRTIHKGCYTIEISGETNETSVRIETTIKSTITLDDNGTFFMIYDTSKLPLGDFIVNVDGKTINAKIVSDESVIPTVTTVTPTPPCTPTATPVIVATPTATTIPTVATTVPLTTLPTTTATTSPTVPPKLKVEKVEVNVGSLNGSYFANVSVTLPNTCYKVLWGNLKRVNNEFFASAKLVRLNVSCIQVLTNVNYSYELGKLKPGAYKFTFKIDERVRSVSFYVKPNYVKPKVERLDISVEPRSLRVKPGERVTYMITLNWYPNNWTGLINASIILSSPEFKKRFELLQINTHGLTPPISKRVEFEVPEDIPLTTYNAEVEVSADSINASNESRLIVSSPGFEIIVCIVVLIILGRRLIQ